MSNNKKKPAAGKSVAGKTNSGKSKDKAKVNQKQRAEAQKQAQRIAAERDKAQRERARKSEEIQKRRAKQSEKEQRLEKKQESKARRSQLKQNFILSLKSGLKRFKYYTSKEFLGSFNYTRIFIFIVLPIVLLGVGIHLFSQTVLMNVPVDIRSYSYSGRLDESAEASKLSESQQAVLADELNSRGSGTFEFYIKPEIRFDSDGECEGLCFGNISENDCVLIAVIYDSEGEILYRSLGLESGKELNFAKLFKNVSFGVHEVKVAVNAYDSETYEKIGTRYAEIMLRVED